MGVSPAPYADYVARLQDLRLAQGEEACAADQLLTLHDIASAQPNGIFLELGTDAGQSTKVILNALSGHQGLLVSVDVEDCDEAGSGPNWRFVQTSSTDVDTVLNAAPELRDGIDMIYVDSLHTVEHVHAEIMAYFPLLRRGGQMLFDDVDPTPYMFGHRKDSARKEISNRAISDLVKGVFYCNPSHLRMDLKLGSTGLAIFTKTSDLGARLAPYTPMVPARDNRELADLHDRLRGHQEYKNSLSSQSMLIPIDSNE